MWHIFEGNHPFMSNDSLINSILDKSFTLESNLPALLDQKLAEYDLSKTKVLNLLNIDKDTFDDIINGTSKQPNLINVIKIANFLELDLSEAVPAILKTKDNVTSIEKAQKAAFVAKNFDIKKLTKNGFFTDSDDISYLLTRILTFFDYGSIKDYEKNLIAPLYSRTKRPHSDKMKTFWINSAYQCFKKIDNPNEYDREALKDIITKIKPYCQDVENGLFTVCKALYSVGVTVIVQSHLPLTQVRGGTFFVNGKPCIVLTDLNKRYTTIWETLIHESHHVLYDLETIKASVFHLSGDPDLLLIEDKAEEFAREYYCGIDEYRYIKPHIHNHFLVARHAKELEVHPSFIYSSFRQFEKILNDKNYYGAFQDYFPDHSLAIKDLHPITWKENSISEVAASLKTIFELNV
jgi:HTH-type transcriptional regulator / antitoxin HigA